MFDTDAVLIALGLCAIAGMTLRGLSLLDEDDK